MNVRVIAATNESLEQAVEDGRFRADLFYRLNVFPVQIPPLRDRQEDLPLLASHFLEKFHAQYDKRTLGLSDKALELCMQYRWPGNIRELENVIERGVILTDNNETISQDALFVSPLKSARILLNTLMMTETCVLASPVGTAEAGRTK